MTEPQQPKLMVTYADFAKLDIRTAKVLAAREHPNADKLIVLDIDLGTEQREIIAGLRPYVDMNTLVGKTIVVIANPAPFTMHPTFPSSLM
jgi:methionyl-tRNA synthetase